MTQIHYFLWLAGLIFVSAFLDLLPPEVVFLFLGCFPGAFHFPLHSLPPPKIFASSHGAFM